MLLKAYEQLRGKIFARRERMLEERERGEHISVFFGTLWLALMELRSIFLRFLILNFSDPAASFKVLLNLKPEDVCTYSYCSYRYLKNRIQIFSLTGTSLIIIGSVLGTFILSIVLPLLALRAQPLSWKSKPAPSTLSKANLFKLGAWRDGYFLDTRAFDTGLELLSNQNFGTGLDGDLAVIKKEEMENILGQNGRCAGKRVAPQFNIFYLEEQAVTLRHALTTNDCLAVGDEVAVLYFNQQANKQNFTGFDTNYIQAIRGRRIILANKFVAKPSHTAVLMRIPQFNNLTIARGAGLLDEPIIVRAKEINNQSKSEIINLALNLESREQGSWLSPIYEINTDNSFIQKIFWEGEATLPREVRLVVGSGNNKNSLGWDDVDMVGCTVRTPCELKSHHANKKYIQVKLILAQASTFSPKIKNISIINNIGQASVPTMVGILDYRLLGMHVLSKNSPDVLLQVRAGQTLAELKTAPWCGFNSCGSGDFFRAANMKKSLPKEHILHQEGNRWFQYRIFSVHPDDELNKNLVRSIKFKLKSIPQSYNKVLSTANY